MAGRISTLDEKLAVLGQTPEDYLPSKLEKFKKAVGYEAYLNVDLQMIREAIGTPDQSHVDEMLSFAEQANREYEADPGGDIAPFYPFVDPVGMVLTDEGKLIGLDLNRSLRNEQGKIYDIVAGLGPESFVSLPPDMVKKYTEPFK